MSESGTEDAITHRRVRIGVVVTAVVVVLVVSLTSLDNDAPASSIVPTATASASSAAARAAALRSSAPPQSSTRAAALSPVEARTDVTEVCGLGRVAIDQVGELDAAQAARASAAITQVIASLSSDADERKRVSGMLMQQAFDVGAADTADRRASAQRCGGDTGCLEDAGQARFAVMARAAQAGSEEIARLATTSRDPYIYAAAMQACGRIGVMPVAAPSCGLLSAEQWARVDPGNAVPWLNVAASARARKDSAAFDEAMYRVSTATSSRIHGTAVFADAAEHAPAGMGDFEQAQIVAFVTGMVAALQLPSYQAALQYCAVPALQDSNRWQACDVMARNFVERPSTLIERRIGLRIGERAKWPGDRMAALREEDDALGRIQSQLLTDRDPSSCRAMAGVRGFWLQAARLGEVGAARALLVASGRSVAALAAETRAERETLSKAPKAEAAAPPASTSSGV